MSQELFLMRWTPLDHRYLPGRGLAGSALVHGLVLCGLLFISLPGSVRARSRSQEEIAYIDLKNPNEVMYLPILGSEAEGAPARESSKVPERIAAAPAVQGLSYPGPQPIHSDFPNPTNSILTVLQPALVNPSILRPPLMLPNVVQMAAISAPPPIPPEAPMKPVLPAIVAILPLDPDVRMVDAIAKTEPLEAMNRPQARVQAPPEPPSKSADPLLVLTPLPSSPRQESLSVPSGEAQARFSISPDAHVAAAGNDPGARTETSGLGGATAAASGIRVETNNNAFPGITILGGASDTGNSRSSANIISIGPSPAPLQTAYGVTVVSTGGSGGSGGGGLPQYGVFSNEQIFTVYLDMRRAIGDRLPSWTLEYAALKPKTVPPPPSLPSAIPTSGSQQGLVLPFPIVKEPPAFPVDLVRKYSRLRIIVYAVINADGRMEQIAVKETPDAAFTEPVLAALARWAFRPALLDGEKTSMKVLIGIPLS